MKIIVLGATGMAGSRVVTEALARGHDVVGVSRRGAPDTPGVTTVSADVTDIERMTSLLAGADAVVCATRPRPGEEHTVPATTAAVLDAAAAAGTRVVVVGGAAPLSSPDRPGLLVLDDPRYVQDAWRDAAVASVEQFRVCEKHSADWVYLSPAAMLEPGERTGRYRRGGTTLVAAPDGTSRISAEDMAVAVLDEIERPCGQRHLGVGY